MFDYRQDVLMSMTSRESRLRIIRWMCVVGAILLGGLALGMWGDMTSPPPSHQTHSLTGMAGPTARPPARVYLRDLVLDAQTLTLSSLPSAATEDGFRLWLVQFPGPIQDAWYDAMVRAELTVISYIPDFTYLVWGEADALSSLRKQAPVRWWAPYAPEYALHPTLRSPSAETRPLTVVVQIVDHPTARSILKAKGYEQDAPLPAIPGTQTWQIRTTTDAVQEIAALPGVVNVEPALVPRLHDERQAAIMIGYLDPDGVAPTGPGYLHWLTATVGMTTTPTAYPIVDVTDDGIDDGDATPSHPDFYAFGDLRNEDRLVYNANWTGDLLADSKGGHGTLDAAIVAGYNDRTGSSYEDTAGYNYGLGINPFGRVAGSKVFDNNANWSNPDYTELIADAYQRGARISSNSWGASAGQGRYRVYDQTYDTLVRDADPDTPGNQAMVVIFSAGNSGPNTQTVGSPANAKNVITVGAAENVRPTWTDGCGYSPTIADNANDIAPFSGRGPTTDGRVKPDLVAPGTHIIGAASQAEGYTGRNVCDPYYPPEQTLYAASSGTSHATPAVAGAASLLIRRYEVWSGAPPSPAMVKALLLNTARYLNGLDSGDTLPSYRQGYGEVNIAGALTDTARILVDQSEILRTTGETYVRHGHVSRVSEPVRVTLAWTDAPGATIGNAYVNDLDLTVEISGATYLGNVFDGAYATPGGTHDRANNVESVSLPPGAQGPLTITVRAYNLAGDGRPGDSDPTDQDFALVCTNCEPEPAFELEAQPLRVDLCASERTTYTITPYARNGFSGSISLEASGYPTGTSATFDPNPSPANIPSHMTLETSPDANQDVYPVKITGTDFSITRALTVTLGLYTQPPETPQLQTPSEDAYDLDRQPTLGWSRATGAQGYRLEIGTEPALDAPLYVTTTAATSHTVRITLDYDTLYYWRVIPLNPCGKGPAPSVWGFTTGEAPLHPSAFIYLPYLSNNASTHATTIGPNRPR